MKLQAEAAFDCPANAENADKSAAELRSAIRRSSPALTVIFYVNCPLIV